MKTLIFAIFAGVVSVTGSDEDSEKKIFYPSEEWIRAYRQMSPSPDGTAVGRYLLMPANGHLFRIDTATGKVWMMQVQNVGMQDGSKITGVGWKVINEDASSDIENQAMARKRVSDLLNAGKTDEDTVKQKAAARPAAKPAATKQAEKQRR